MLPGLQMKCHTHTHKHPTPHNYLHIHLCFVCAQHIVLCAMLFTSIFKSALNTIVQKKIKTWKTSHHTHLQCCNSVIKRQVDEQTSYNRTRGAVLFERHKQTHKQTQADTLFPWVLRRCARPTWHCNVFTARPSSCLFASYRMNANIANNTALQDMLTYIVYLYGYLSLTWVP